MSARTDYPDPTSETDREAMYDEIDHLRDKLPRLQESYDALVSNSSAEHQRMSDLCQALSTNVTRLDEEKVQDAHTIDYLRGQLERRDSDFHTLYSQCEDIKEQYRHESQLMFLEQQRWQEMAEDLWEELQEWHTPDCSWDRARSLPAEIVSQWSAEPECTCHRILATKWDELTHAADYADDGFDDITEPPREMPSHEVAQ